MTDFARFGIELIDEVSAPAHKAADAIGHIEEQLHGLSVGHALEKIGEAASHVAHIMEHTFMHGVHKVESFVEKLVEGTVEMAMHADASRRAMTALTGSHEKGEEAFQRTIALSKEYGLSVDMATHSMQKMLAMQFTSAEGEKFIKLTSDLRSVGVTEDATERILLDVAHIKATGKLNGRELQTFAMAGMSTALIMKEVGVGLAKSHGGVVQTVEQAYEAMHKGKVTSDIMLPALERAVLAKTHEHEAGEAGLKFAQGSLSGLWQSLKNMPGQLYLRVSETLPSLLPKLTAAVQQMKDFIGGLDVDKLGKFVEGILDTMLQVVPLVKGFAEGFMEGFGEMASVFANMHLGADSLKTAHDLGKAFAKVLGQMLELMTKLAKVALPLLATDMGKWGMILGYGATKLAGIGGKAGGIAAMLGGGAPAGGDMLHDVVGHGKDLAEGAGLLKKGWGLASGSMGLAATEATGLAAALGPLAVALAALAAVAGAAWLGYQIFEHFQNKDADARGEAAAQLHFAAFKAARKQRNVDRTLTDLNGAASPLLTDSELGARSPPPPAGEPKPLSVAALAAARVTNTSTMGLTQNLYFGPGATIDPSLVQGAVTAANNGAHESWDQHRQQLGSGKKKT